MAALVRIKRRLDEDALESLVLNCKKRKTVGSEHEESEDLSAYLRLAGTSENEENIETILRKHRVSELKDQFKKPPVKFSEKLRTELRESSKNSRYKVVNRYRQSLNEEEDSQVPSTSSSRSEVTVLDLETDLSRSEVASTSNETENNSSKYVYDFYYTSSDDLGHADIEDYVSVQPMYDPLVFGSAKDNGLCNEEDNCYEDSDDSNSESNWRNDYPDEEDLNSVTEDDMIAAMKDMKVGHDSSSEYDDVEDDDDSLNYSKEVEDIDFEEKVETSLTRTLLKEFSQKLRKESEVNHFYYEDIDDNEYY